MTTVVVSEEQASTGDQFLEGALPHVLPEVAQVMRSRPDLTAADMRCGKTAPYISVPLARLVIAVVGGIDESVRSALHASAEEGFPSYYDSARLAFEDACRRGSIALPSYGTESDLEADKGAVVSFIAVLTWTLEQMRPAVD